MPKPPRRNKNFQPGAHTGSRTRGGKAIAVKELLAKAGISPSGIAQHTVKQRGWQDFLAQTLPAALASRVGGVSLERGVLTVLAESPAWAVRLRYALAEAMAEIVAYEPSVRELAVKVSGRGG